MNIILIGIQGSGKGTQARLLSEKLGWEHVNVGALFRNHIEKQTDLGKIAQMYINQGNLVPDEYVYDMVGSELRKAKNGFILDGFPRTVEQEKYLLDHFRIDKVVWLNLDDEIAISRISARWHCDKCKRDYNMLASKPKQEGICDECGGVLVQREDDTREAIIKRLNKFHEKTKKVFKLVKKKNLLVKINADQPVMDIHQEILDKLELK